MRLENAVRFKTIFSYRWDAEAQEMQQDLYNNFGDIRWSFYKLFEQPDFFRNVLDLFLDEVPLHREEMWEISQEMRHDSGVRRIDNFREFISQFVTNHVETHHDNSVSLRTLREMVGLYDANDKDMVTNLNAHLRNAISDKELSQELVERFPRIAEELSNMIMEFQEGIQNNTEISLIFMVFHAEIGGKHFVIPEPLFRIDSGENIYAFLDRSLRFFTWPGYLIYCSRLGGRYCYPKNGIYTVDSSNQVQIAFDGTFLEKYEICETMWSLSVSTEPINCNTNIVCSTPEEDSCNSSITKLIAEAYQSRTAWLPKVVSVLSMATIGVHKASVSMAKRGRVCGRPARIAVSALNASAITAHACNVANIVCSLPGKYEKGTLTVYDTIDLCESVSGFHSFMKKLRKYAAIYRETLKVQRRKGAGKHGRCIYREILKDIVYDIVREHVPGTVTPVTKIDNNANLRESRSLLEEITINQAQAEYR